MRRASNSAAKRWRATWPDVIPDSSIPPVIFDRALRVVLRPIAQSGCGAIYARRDRGGGDDLIALTVLYHAAIVRGMIGTAHMNDWKFYYSAQL
jgi:hypothetical protein